MRTSTKRILITGATSGIGLFTCQQLCRDGHILTFTARCEKKAEHVLALIKEDIPECDVRYVLMDLSCLSSVQNATTQLLQMPTFDVVILNAGVMFPDETQTKHGIESTFQVNYLAHYLLSTSLIAKRPEGFQMNIVCLSSVLLKMCGNWPWRIPRDSSKWEPMFAPRGRSGWKKYALSKFALAVFAETLNRVDGVTAVAVNPGNTITSVTRNMNPKHKKFFKVFKNSLIPVTEAAENVVRAAMHPLPPGHYYDKSAISLLPKVARSEYSANSLVALSEKLLDQVQPNRKTSGSESVLSG